MSTSLLCGGKVGYVHIAAMADTEQNREALSDFARQVAGLPAVVIDIRGNGGGSDGLRSHLVGELADRDVPYAVRVLFPAGGYAAPFLAGRNLPLLPKAEAFAIWCKTTGRATIVPVVLPHSKLVFTLPPAPGLNPGGQPNEEYHTSPDIPVKLTFEELMDPSTPRPGPDPSTDRVLREGLRQAGFWPDEGGTTP